MEVRIFTIGDLEQGSSGKCLWEGEVQAITQHRAFAQARNPRASASDPALIVVFEGDRVIGYQGILPDRFYIDGTVHKMGWLTTWWVDPSAITKGVGALLLFQAFKLYDNRIAVRELSQEAKAAFKRFKRMIFLEDTPGLTLLFRFNTREIAPQYVSQLVWFRSIFGMIDTIGNCFVQLRLRLWQGRYPIGDGVAVHFIHEVDDETERFIEKWNGNELTRRGKSELNWFIQFPWVLGGLAADSREKRYYFSSAVTQFSYVCIQIRDRQNQLIGFIILRIRDNQLAVPYVYFDPVHTDLMLRVIGHQVVRLNVNRLIIYNSALLGGLSKIGFPVLYRRHQARAMAVSDCFKGIDPCQMVLQDGDGDCVFT